VGRQGGQQNGNDPGNPVDGGRISPLDRAARKPGQALGTGKGAPLETPPPNEVHGILTSWLAHLLWEYILRQRGGKGRVTSNDTGLIVERDPDTVRGPDLMFFADSLRVESLSRSYPTSLPSLVVEVKSPSDTFASMVRRALQYLERGVPLVWLLDPEGQTISVHQADEFPVCWKGMRDWGTKRCCPIFAAALLMCSIFPKRKPQNRSVCL